MSLDEALGLTVAEATGDSIHIDVNTRQVTVPESQRLFGVESDENVEVKHIVLDGRYNDGTDLSALTLRVNWRNANGGKGSYLVTNLDVTEDSIAFDWVISRGVVAYKGTVYFIVCAFKVNSTGKTEQEWNSSLGQGSVLEGLEVTDEDIGGDDTVNRMLTILQQMNSVQTAAKNSADAAAASNKSASDTAGSIKDSLDQIAENKAGVSQLKEATSALKDGKINKFYASSQGDTNLPDSDDGRIMDLKLYGKSEQKQYSGKNLLAPKEAKFVQGYTITINGITFTVVENGGVSASGTATALTFFSPYYVKLKAGVTYRAVSNSAVEWTMRDIGGASVYFGEGDTSYTPKSDLESVIFFRVAAGKTINATEYAMVTTDLSATATSYEPYVGGIPSPNPEYPQEIKSVVKPRVKVCGKNLISKHLTADGTYNGLTYKTEDFGNIKVTGTNTSANANNDFKVFALTGVTGKYTASAKSTDSNISWRTIHNGAWSAGGTFDMQPTDTLLIWLNIKAGATVNGTIKIIVEKGETATAYEPYTEQTVTLPYTLNAIPVTSGGNVTIDGQQYIADYVDVEKGKLVRMVDSSKLDTTQSIIDKTDWLLATHTETDLTADEIAAFKALVSYYPVTNVSTTSDQLDGYTVFNYPISLAKGYDYLKTQLGDTRDYLYGIDLMTAEAYVNSEYAAALAEIEV